MTDLEVYLCMGLFFVTIWALGATMHLLDATENARRLDKQLRRLQELRRLDNERLQNFRSKVEELRDSGLI